MNNKKTALCAVLAALSIVFGYVESLFPLPVPVYGVKVGISNSVILAAMYMVGGPVPWIVMIIKTLCQALLFSGFSPFLYSVSGGILSVLGMTALKKTGKFGVPGVSVVGGVLHNIGQLLCAGVILKTINIFYYLPVLIISGVVSGFVIGVATDIILKRLKLSIGGALEK